MKTALILGGSGQIGQATARNLLADGWSVRLAQRHAAHLPDDLADRLSGWRWTANSLARWPGLSRAASTP